MSVTTARGVEAHQRIGVPGELRSAGLVGILRAPSADRFIEVAGVLVDAGIRCLEITLTSRGALTALRGLSDTAPDGVSLGAGTVLSTDDVDAAADAGAAFVVSPVFDADVVRRATELGLPSFPGAFSATEILTAWRAGATAVKVFPAAAAGGPSYLRSLRGPLPDIPLLPTGGIEIEDAAGYLAAGAVAVGVGAPLLGDAADNGDLAALGDRARRLVDSCRRERG